MEWKAEFLSDEKGFWDRECPNEECMFEFKVNMEDWKNKFEDDAVYCPQCGVNYPSDHWWTQDQLEHIENQVRARATNYIMGELNKSFSDLERSTRRNKNVKFKFKPYKPITILNNPYTSSETWEQTIMCKKCDSSFSVIGFAYFCPCCGSSLLIETLMSSLEMQMKILGTSPENIVDIDLDIYSSKMIYDSIIESTLGNIVSIFQKVGQEIIKQSCNIDNRVNDFQIIQKGSEIFKENVGVEYIDIIDETEYEVLVNMFQVRHIFVHNGGIIDEKFIQKFGLNENKIGNRYVLKKDEVVEFAVIVQKLLYGLLEHTKGLGKVVAND